MERVRPKFSFKGDRERSLARYMEAWRFLDHSMKTYFDPNASFAGPFVKRFPDGSVFTAKREKGIDRIEVYTPNYSKTSIEDFYVDRDLSLEKKYGVVAIRFKVFVAAQKGGVLTEASANGLFISETNVIDRFPSVQSYLHWGQDYFQVPSTQPSLAYKIIFSDGTTEDKVGYARDGSSSVVMASEEDVFLVARKKFKSIRAGFLRGDYNNLLYSYCGRVQDYNILCIDKEVLEERDIKYALISMSRLFTSNPSIGKNAYMHQYFKPGDGETLHLMRFEEKSSGNGLNFYNSSDSFVSDESSIIEEFNFLSKDLASVMNFHVPYHVTHRTFYEYKNADGEWAELEDSLLHYFYEDDVFLPCGGSKNPLVIRRAFEYSSSVPMEGGFAYPSYKPFYSSTYIYEPYVGWGSERETQEMREWLCPSKVLGGCFPQDIGLMAPPSACGAWANYSWPVNSKCYSFDGRYGYSDFYSIYAYSSPGDYKGLPFLADYSTSGYDSYYKGHSLQTLNKYSLYYVGGGSGPLTYEASGWTALFAERSSIGDISGYDQEPCLNAVNSTKCYSVSKAETMSGEYSITTHFSTMHIERLKVKRYAISASVGETPKGSNPVIRTPTLSVEWVTEGIPTFQDNLTYRLRANKDVDTTDSWDRYRVESPVQVPAANKAIAEARFSIVAHWGVGGVKKIGYFPGLGFRAFVPCFDNHPEYKETGDRYQYWVGEPETLSGDVFFALNRERYEPGLAYPYTEFLSGGYIRPCLPTLLDGYILFLWYASNADKKRIHIVNLDSTE